MRAVIVKDKYLCVRHDGGALSFKGGLLYAAGSALPYNKSVEGLGQGRGHDSTTANHKQLSWATNPFV